MHVFVVVAIVAQVVLFGLGCAHEFRFIPVTSTQACLEYRSSANNSFAYVVASQVTKRSAVLLCKTYHPSSITGTIETSNSNCFQQYGVAILAVGNAYIDCPDNSVSYDNCSVTGSTTPDAAAGFYAATVACVTPMWATSSQITKDAYSTLSVSASGGSGSLSISNTAQFDGIRPSSSFDAGTICISNVSDTDNNVAKALCRAAGLPVTVASLTTSPTTTNVQRYISDIRCSDSASASLWNAGCTFATNYFGDVPNCISTQPQVLCTKRFDMQLGPVLTSSAGGGVGFQQVQLWDGTSYNGRMCVYPVSSYATYFATAICTDLYGSSNIDFAAAFTGSFDAGSASSLLISDIQCQSSGITSLSQCSATAADSGATMCSTYGALVACTINEVNTQFSLDNSGEGIPGMGYLMVTVAVTGQPTAAVCYDGFNQAAALAACRSVGYTPGSGTTFTFASAPASYAINRVTCPPNANKLTDCTLRYVGVGHKASPSDAASCSGRVHINCNLGTPTVEYRMTPSPGYKLQARLFNNAMWGWVSTGAGVTNSEGNAALCSKVTVGGGDVNARASYLSVSSCPSNPSSLADCSFTYTDGLPATTGFTCHSKYYPESNSNAGPGSLPPGAVIGIACGGGSVLIIIVSVCLLWHCRRGKAGGVTITGDAEEMSWHRTTPNPSPPTSQSRPVNGLVMSWHRAPLPAPEASPVGPMFGGGGIYQSSYNPQPSSLYTQQDPSSTNQQSHM